MRSKNLTGYKSALIHIKSTMTRQKNGYGLVVFRRNILRKENHSLGMNFSPSLTYLE